MIVLDQAEAHWKWKNWKFCGRKLKLRRFILKTNEFEEEKEKGNLKTLGTIINPFKFPNFSRFRQTFAKNFQNFCDKGGGVMPSLPRKNFFKFPFVVLTSFCS